MQFAIVGVMLIGFAGVDYKDSCGACRQACARRVQSMKLSESEFAELVEETAQIAFIEGNIKG